MLFYIGSGGVLGQCIEGNEAKESLMEVLEKTCGTGDGSLYLRVQRQGYYWPSMAKDAAEFKLSVQYVLVSQILQNVALWKIS